MINLLAIGIVASVLTLIFRGQVLVRLIAIGALWFVLAMFLVGVQTSSRLAMSKKHQKDKVIPSEEWLDGAVQARLEATWFLPEALICILGLSILAAVPVKNKGQSSWRNTCKRLP
jgi:hypothetical protein